MSDDLRDYQDVINGRYVYALEAFVAELAMPGSMFKSNSKKLSEIMSDFLNLVKIDFIESKCFNPETKCWDHRLSREFTEHLTNAVDHVKSFEVGSVSKEAAEEAVDRAYSSLKEMSRHFFFYANLQSRKRLEPKENP